MSSADNSPGTYLGSLEAGKIANNEIAPTIRNDARESGVERTHQPTWVQRDLHGSGLLRPNPLTRLSDHTVDQPITPAVVWLSDRQPPIASVRASRSCSRSI